MTPETAQNSRLDGRMAVQAITRHTDPETSLEAASRVVVSGSLAGSQAEVMLILQRFGPLTDEQIELANHNHEGARRYSGQRLRSARAELVAAGKVRFTGRYEVRDGYRRTRVWGVV